MTTVFKLHPEFSRRDTDEGTDKDFEKVIKDIACKTGSHNLHSDMNDRETGVFHVQCMSCDIHVWIKTFFKP